jgi:hypothetical protein
LPSLEGGASAKGQSPQLAVSVHARHRSSATPAKHIHSKLYQTIS